jgi:hypothetical protein
MLLGRSPEQQADDGTQKGPVRGVSPTLGQRARIHALPVRRAEGRVEIRKLGTMHAYPWLHGQRARSAIPGHLMLGCHINKRDCNACYKESR